MKYQIKSVAAAGLLLVSSHAVQAESVNIGAPAWTGAQAIAHLIQEIVVTKIGGTAELVPGNNAAIFQAMDQGKGDIDVHPCLLYTSPSPRDLSTSRMPSSA